MLRVGLTGGLGSGKSTAGDIFRSLGVHISDSDAVGRELMQPGQVVYDEIVRHFGPEVLLPADAQGLRQLDRTALARIAFTDGRVEELNGIVHPAVIAAQAKWVDDIGAQDPNAIAMVESALLFETKYGGGPIPEPHGDAEDREIAAAISTTCWQTRFDRMVLITARDDIKIHRYVSRIAAGRTLTPAERNQLQDDARRRLAAQIPDEVKSPLSDYVIENNGDIETLTLSIRRVHAALRSSVAALARHAPIA
ncbi:MAG: dephospho-CoA kinase [Acidobacteriaceae bacterium]|nr:dephospho-CoA kinase [Acidobacteriaceae bacterium]